MRLRGCELCVICNLCLRVCKGRLAFVKVDPVPGLEFSLGLGFLLCMFLVVTVII